MQQVSVQRLRFSTFPAARRAVCLACAIGLWGGALAADSAAQPPEAPRRGDVEAAITPARPDANAQRSLRIVLLADRKDHGPNAHDYPLWQERWSLLLGGSAASSAKQTNLYGPPVEDGQAFEGAENVTVERAWQWPADAQFATADVIVAFCYLSWTDEHKRQVRHFLDRGGGLVLIHAATWTKPKADPDVGALTGVGGFTRYRHGSLSLDLVAPEDPVCRGLPACLGLHDEPYWPPTPALDAARVKVLAVSQERSGEADVSAGPQPMVWACRTGRGRVFGCVPGHYTWTFDDPWFRLWLLRGVAWAAGDSPGRLDVLALRGARVRD